MSNSDFVLAIDRFIEKAGMNLDTFVKRVVFEIYVDVVMMTPVDTGRLRANFQIGVNTRPTGDVIGPFAASGGEKGSHRKEGVKAARTSSAGMSEAMARGTAGINGVTWGTIVYIANNLPYALPIEMGHSQQAPHGMVRIAVRRMADRLKSAGGL